MKYEKLNGVVHTKICGVHVLIPTRPVFDRCHKIQKLPLIWAMTWDILGQEDDERKILALHSMMRKLPEEKARKELEQFCEAMAEKGFLQLREEEP